ncbi:MAG: UDP-N-acetylmuramoyl-tripeptide--D-alanyl-D-alanine ligase [Clostridiales bacterium]|nr:UDP-N-acetylmuramoyl-tripeptide--D-alanyl-D-alanine ligase [Clostridiales bacterium]
MEHMTIKDIVEATGGTLLCGDEQKEIRDFSIDSRVGSEDSIFVPIIGERVDAHRFIESALRINGATFTSEHGMANQDKAWGRQPEGIVQDKPWERLATESGIEKPWIAVEDTVKAMQQVETFYRNRLSLPVVAVTGSVGKTTTREMIATALSAGKNVFQTMGNQNSQIGVPLTLSHMTKDHEAAVLEIGMSERGQIETLTKMIRPNIAVVTVIGVSHIAQLKSQENICLEKMDIIKGLTDDGMVFLNGDDPFLTPYRGKLDKKTLFYGLNAECDYRAENIKNVNGQTTFTFCVAERRLPVLLNTMGEHNVRNALVALGVAHQMGVDLEQAAAKLAEFHGQRQRLVSCPRCTMIDDAYNASPDSMRASIHVLSSMEGVKGRRIAVLGDMLELGENEKKYHYEVGEYIATQNVDEVVVTGELSREILRGIADAEERETQREHTGCEMKSDHRIVNEKQMPKTPKRKALKYLESREEMTAYLLEHLHPEDVVLFKASNGMKLSEVSKAIAVG